ncbi:hypothetical protein FJR03_03170 [Sulfurimonas marina]|uniref:Glycosyltransferase RgtA/B/C/D-like domain-containing protein n=2 Tax=Sulfurimonas marina TaxID=2590551 RepID=A0A7M1ATP0_9BACT|nr:hypothetical protein FJR03_03170 [Sulfurimonas marina]
MIQKFIFFLILGIDVTILFFQIDNLSVSSAETYILYEENSFLSSLFNFLLATFGNNDYTLRIPIILIHLISTLLFYEISKKYVATTRNRLWLLLLYVMLPGTLSAAIVLSHAFLILFGLLLFIYLDQRFPTKYTNPLLLVYAFIDGGFAYLLLGVLIYNIFVKDYKNIVYNLILLTISAYMYRLQIYGVPSGHFLDTIAVYSAIFTPIVFVYLVYALYRKYLADKIDKVWYIATSALIFSLLLSFRQRLDIEYFAPYLMIALPLAAQTFIHSYRVRLKMFRKRYQTIFVLSFLFLFLNTLIVLFNKPLYRFIDNPKKHFVYNMYVAKELAQELKNMNINCINTDFKMQQRLQFYGIEKCSDYILKEIDLEGNRDANVTISYKTRAAYKGSVTKVNIK